MRGSGLCLKECETGGQGSVEGGRVGARCTSSPCSRFHGHAGDTLIDEI